MTIARATLSLSARIAGALSLPSILRRAVALSLHAEMLGLADTMGTAADWRALARLLRECSLELFPRPHMVPPVDGDYDRAFAFGALADDAWNRSTMMRVRIERDALREGRRVPRVIEATCTEVVS